MRRKVSAFLAVAIAMLLSVALAVPANADVTPGKPIPTDPRFKYGLSYYYKELFDPTNPSGVRPLNVNGTVNPSNTGGSWYLNNIKQARMNSTANKPLTGKLFLPGEPLPSGAPSGTVVKPPSVYKPVAPFTGGSLFSGSALFGKLLGTAGFGMGGVTQSPSNTMDIAASQGVASGCISNQSTCSSTDMGKLFAIANCGHTATCKSIGAKDAGGTPITSDTDWWRDTAIPFLGDLWAKITGQTDAVPLSSDTQINVTTRGCNKQIFFSYQGNNNGAITVAVTLDHGRPPSTQTVNRTYYDAVCLGANATAPTVTPGQFQTVCLDKSTGLVATSTYSNGGPISGTWWDQTTGANKGSLCGPGTAATHTLLSIRFWNDRNQAYFDGSAPDWDALDYSEWVNPDPNLDSIDSSAITTTVDCAAPNGQTFTYSETVKQVAAFSAPACPPGFDLARSDVKAATAEGTKTLDSSAVDPAAAAKYPLCDQRTGPGCSLWIALDGTPCKTTRSECATWSDVQAQTPSRVQCKWGTYVMPISDCYGIAEAYKTETGVVHDPKSDTWVAVDANGNPKAVSPQPWNSANPAPVAGATPGTTPANPTSAIPSSGTNPSNGCDAPGWSWNPVEWVHNPVVCALKDAFVPKTDIKARAQALTTSAQQTVPIAWISQPIVGPSGGSCPNWNIKVDGLDRNVVCDSSFTGAILGSRGPMFGIVASAMIWPLLRGIWYALIPIVRVTPSGSK